MSRANGNPEWSPDDQEGNDWTLISYKGRYLGRVVRFDVFDGFGGKETIYLSEKLCCKSVGEHRCMRSAASRVETVLYCTECKKSCLVSN